MTMTNLSKYKLMMIISLERVYINLKKRHTVSPSISNTNSRERGADKWRKRRKATHKNEEEREKKGN